VSRPIACGFERGNLDPEVALELVLGPKHQLADARMQTVSAHDEIEGAWGMSVERDSNVLDGLVDARDGVAEDRFSRVAEGAIDGGREIATRHARESTADGSSKGSRGKPRDPPTVAVHDPDFANRVAGAKETREQSHSTPDFETSPPEVDDVAACPKRRRL